MITFVYHFNYTSIGKNVFDYFCQINITLEIEHFMLNSWKEEPQKCMLDNAGIRKKKFDILFGFTIIFVYIDMLKGLFQDLEVEIVWKRKINVFLEIHHLFLFSATKWSVTTWKAEVLGIFSVITFFCVCEGNGGVQKVFIETCAVCRPRQRGLGNKLWEPGCDNHPA